MKIKKLLCVLLSLCALLPMALGAYAAEVESGDVYCFTSQDFSEEEGLRGICITGLPDPAAGTIVLGSRVLREGDILTADQIAQMTFLPLQTQEDAQAQVEYLPIYDNRVERETAMTLPLSRFTTMVLHLTTR